MRYWRPTNSQSTRARAATCQALYSDCRHAALIYSTFATALPGLIYHALCSAPHLRACDDYSTPRDECRSPVHFMLASLNQQPFGYVLGCWGVGVLGRWGLALEYSTSRDESRSPVHFMHAQAVNMVAKICHYHVACVFTFSFVRRVQVRKGRLKRRRRNPLLFRNNPS
jgi:hypothetical protein